MSAYPLDIKPLQDGYTIEVSPNSVDLRPSVGTSLLQAVNNDESYLITLKWRLDKKNARTLIDWFREDLDNGANTFTMPLLIEAGIVEQTCVFVENSFQYTPDGNGQFYDINAQIFVANVNNPDTGDFY